MRTIRLHRVGLFSTFRFGTILGGILLIVPVFLFTALFFWSAGMLAAWMEGMRGALPLVGDLSVPIDTISLLGLQQVFQTVEMIAGVSAWLAVFFGLFLWLILALFTGLTSLLAAAVFNVIASAVGGIEVDIIDSKVDPL